MIDFSQDYFTLFGLPARYRFDPAALETAYHALQRAVHPDRHAAGGDTERRLALQSSARVNEAYRALKDPIGRAVYLLSLHGVDALAETDTALPMPFLQRELERREAMAEAQATGDSNALTALLHAVHADAAALETVLAEQLDREEGLAARAAKEHLTAHAASPLDLTAAIAEVDG